MDVFNGKLRNLFHLGLPSPSGRSSKSSEAGGLQRSQTIGQRIMGNMMDNLFLRSLTSKSKAGGASDVSVPSSPVKVFFQKRYIPLNTFWL